MRRKRKRRGGMSKFKAGLIGLVVLIIFVYLGFTKFANPFSNPYTVSATFANANEVRPGSFVRIAGVNVGVVTGIQPVATCKGENPCSAARISMQIQPMGLPLHKDATFAIRPRLFLEGNFFIDVDPGSPSAPDAPSGFTFPISQGVEPVQFDQVLTSLQSDTRHNLQILLQQYGTAVKQGGPSFNRSVQYWLPAYEYSAIVNHDALGIQPHDLSNWIAEQGPVAAAIDAHPQNLENLVTDFNTTALAFGRESTALEDALTELPRTLSVAIPAFNALNAAFPPLRTLARTLVPGVQSTGPMIDASLPFFTQLRLLMQPSELQGLSKDLTVTIPALTRLTKGTIPFLRDQVRPASSCVVNNIIPWSHLTVPDSHFNAANGFPPRPVYVEAVDYLPGLAGESRNFDAVSPYVRVGISVGSSLTYSLANGFFGQSGVPITGMQPTLPPGDKRPPLAGGDIPNYPCETQPAITDLSAPTATAPRPVNPGITTPTTTPLPTVTTPTVPTVTVPKLP